MKYLKWYIEAVVRVALALFDHVNLKVVGFDKEEDRIQALIRDN